MHLQDSELSLQLWTAGFQELQGEQNLCDWYSRHLSLIDLKMNSDPPHLNQ